MELWKFDGQKMIPVRTFPDEFIDIRVITWSPDSQTVAYGGLSKKNTIKVRHIHTGNTREVSIALAVCGLSFDPFGKYLLLFLRNNIVCVYNSNTLTKAKEIPLSPDASTL